MPLTAPYMTTTEKKSDQHLPLTEWLKKICVLHAELLTASLTYCVRLGLSCDL